MTRRDTLKRELQDLEQRRIPSGDWRAVKRKMRAMATLRRELRDRKRAPASAPYDLPF